MFPPNGVAVGLNSAHLSPSGNSPSASTDSGPQQPPGVLSGLLPPRFPAVTIARQDAILEAKLPFPNRNPNARFLQSFSRIRGEIPCLYGGGAATLVGLDREAHLCRAAPDGRVGRAMAAGIGD